MLERMIKRLFLAFNIFP